MFIGLFGIIGRVISGADNEAVDDVRRRKTKGTAAEFELHDAVVGAVAGRHGEHVGSIRQVFIAPHDGCAANEIDRQIDREGKRVVTLATGVDLRQQDNDTVGRYGDQGVVEIESDVLIDVRGGCSWAVSGDRR